MSIWLISPNISAIIGHSSPTYAERMIDRIVARVDTLSEFPEMGRVVPEARDEDIREIFERPYRIIYFAQATRVDVLAIVQRPAATRLANLRGDRDARWLTCEKILDAITGKGFLIGGFERAEPVPPAGSCPRSSNWADRKAAWARARSMMRHCCPNMVIWFCSSPISIRRVCRKNLASSRSNISPRRSPGCARNQMLIRRKSA
ncbi:MAG: type II toxin-antitoxin system RelE/ParE family toxin [Gemmatimonadaceae bacterium]